MTLGATLKPAAKRVLGPGKAEIANRIYLNRARLTDGSGYLAKLATILGIDKWGFTGTRSTTLVTSPHFAGRR